MAVFPEQMDKLDLNDTTGSLQRMENYIRYMTERMEFANRNTTRTVTDAGVSTVGVYKAVITLADTVSVLQSNLNILNANLTTMSNNVTKLSDKVDDLTTAVDEVKADISSIEADISDLAARVATLEEGTEA